MSQLSQVMSVNMIHLADFARWTVKTGATGHDKLQCGTYVTGPAT